MLRHCAESAREASSQAAGRIAEVLDLAIETRGIATVALSGGSSPHEMFRHLARADLDWSLVHVFQVDERIVDAGSTDRNWRHISELVVLPTGAVGHPLSPPSLAGEPPRLDLVHLGIGPDGHTASWPPNHPVLNCEDPVAFVQAFNGYDRVTLTPPVVNGARHILWLVLGHEKKSILERFLSGDQSIPASVVSWDHAELFTDVDI